VVRVLDLRRFGQFAPSAHVKCVREATILATAKSLSLSTPSIHRHLATCKLTPSRVSFIILEMATAKGKRPGRLFLSLSPFVTKGVSSYIFAASPTKYPQAKRTRGNTQPEYTEEDDIEDPDSEQDGQSSSEENEGRGFGDALIDAT
jgi:hypothetical protein